MHAIGYDRQKTRNEEKTMNTYHLSVVTPDGVAFDGEAESLRVRASDGDVEILASHIDYVATLGCGKAKITAGGVSRIAACCGGFLSVCSGEVKLIATTFEFGDDIDIDRARKAKERAEATLATESDGKAIELAKAKLERALIRIGAKEESC